MKIKKNKENKLFKFTKTYTVLKTILKKGYIKLNSIQIIKGYGATWGANALKKLAPRSSKKQAFFKLKTLKIKQVQIRI